MKFLVLLSAVALASCSPIAQDESVMKLVIGNFVNCMNNDLGMCFKEHALKATERLRAVRELKIVDGVTLINNGPKEARSLELVSEPEARSKQVTDQLWESTSDLLKNSELELSWAGPAEEAEEEESRAIDNAAEGRGKKKKEVKKKLKILIPLLLLGKVKVIALVVGSLLVIAASLAKIAILAKIAFIAKVIAIIKALILKKKMQEEHGWAHVEEHGSQGGHGGGWDGGWSRSRNEANNLAYSAHVQ